MIKTQQNISSKIHNKSIKIIFWHVFPFKHCIFIYDRFKNQKSDAVNLKKGE